MDLLDPSGAVRGDLDEEFARYQVPARGRMRAHVWYWGQVLRTAPRLVAGVRGQKRAGSVAGRVVDDIAQAIRVLRRRPRSTALIVGTLGLGLGANAAVFSLVHSIILRPLPFENSDRLVRIRPDVLFYTQLGEARALAEASATIEAGLPWGRTLLLFTDADPAAEVRGAEVEWDHFDRLGTRPLLGRGFRRDDAAAESPDAIVIAHGLWVRRFGADPLVVGRRVEVRGQSRTIVGVMGPDHVPMEPDWEAWSPLPLDAELAAGSAMAMNALLRPGVTLDEAHDDVRRAFAEVWARRGSIATAEELAGMTIVPLRDHLLGRVDRPLGVLLGSVLAVLLLACANVANLRLAEGSSRKVEIAVRSSLGASRMRILGQLLWEVILLAVLGSGLALLLAWTFHAWGVQRLPQGLPRSSEWAVGGVVVAYTLAAALLAVLLSGVLPAWHTAAGRGAAGIARGGRSSASRLSGALIMAEMAGSVVLLVGAGLMLRSFAALRDVDPGFEAEGAVAVRVVPSGIWSTSAEGVEGFYRRVEGEAGGLRGFEAVGSIMFLPMTPGGAYAAFREFGAAETTADSPSTSFRIITPGYLAAMGVALRAGRTFDGSEEAGGVEVGLVNETLARQAFGAEDAVGRMLMVGREEPRAIQVIGVVADVRQSDLREAGMPELYRPLAQQVQGSMYVVARTDLDPSDALAALQASIKTVDSNAVLSRSATVSDVVGRTLGQTRSVAQLLTLFSVVALVLGAVGVYGVASHAVARQRREIGIRLALGARADQEARRTVGVGLRPVLAGLGVGIAVAMAGSGVLSTLVYGVGTRDLGTFLAVPLVLALAAVASIGVPAIRVTAIDPVRSLQDG
jgi:predicted permease